MCEREFQDAFGPTPPEFRARVNDALDKIDKEKIMKKKLSLVLLVALITVLLAGGALAAGKLLGAWDYLGQSASNKPLPEGQALEQAVGATAKTQDFAISVQDAVYDGHKVQLAICVDPLNEGAQPVAWFDASDDPMPGVEPRTTFAEAAKAAGRTLSSVALTALSVDGKDAFNTFDCRYEGASAVIYARATIQDAMRAVPIHLEVRQADGKPVPIDFTLDAAKAETESLEFAQPIDLDGLTISDIALTRTPLATYVEICYQIDAQLTESQSKKVEALTFEFLDAAGNPIESGEGGTYFEDGADMSAGYAGLKFDYQGEIQALASFGDSLSLRLFNYETKDRYETVPLKIADAKKAG